MVMIGKKPQYIVRIYGIDNLGSIREIADTTAKIHTNNKTNIKMLLLNNPKIGLSPDNIPSLPNFKGQQIVNILQGEDNKGKKGADKYRYMDVLKITVKDKIGLGMQDGDLSWGMNAWDNFIIPSKFALLNKLIPYLGLTIMGLFIFLIIFQIIKGSPVFADGANAFATASEHLKQATIGTVVVS